MRAPAGAYSARLSAPRGASSPSINGWRPRRCRESEPAPLEPPGAWARRGGCGSPRRGRSRECPTQVKATQSYTRSLLGLLALAICRYKEGKCLLFLLQLSLKFAFPPSTSKPDIPFPELFKQCILPPRCYSKRRYATVNGGFATVPMFCLFFIYFG